MNKETRTILTPEFLELWSDRCNLPVVQMKEIYNHLKETLKDCTSQGHEIKLSNFLHLIPKMPEARKYFNVHKNQESVKEYDKPVYRCKLSPYLRNEQN